MPFGAIPPFETPITDNRPVDGSFNVHRFALGPLTNFPEGLQRLPVCIRCRVDTRYLFPTQRYSQINQSYDAPFLVTSPLAISKSGETVAVVTGGNRGIGLEIVRQMASKGLTVVLTSRNEQRGLDATQSLLEQGFRKVFFRILDVQSSDSISQFAEWLHNKFGGLDILINNAGIGETEVDWDLMKQQGKDYRTILLSSKSDRAVIFDYESTRMCIDTNYYGAKRTIKALMPLLRASSARPRIVNVSSAFGLLAMLPNQTLRTQLSDVSNVNEEFIDSVLNRFLEDVKTNTENLEEKGWPVPFSGYKMSKIALNAYTRLLAAEVGERGRVNCVHPGYVRTDMTFNTGDLSATEGAANVVRVALDPPDGPSGHIFLQKEIGCF